MLIWSDWFFQTNFVIFRSVGIRRRGGECILRQTIDTSFVKTRPMVLPEELISYPVSIFMLLCYDCFSILFYIVFSVFINACSGCHIRCSLCGITATSIYLARLMRFHSLARPAIKLFTVLCTIGTLYHALFHPLFYAIIVQLFPLMMLLHASVVCFP